MYTTHTIAMPRLLLALLAAVGSALAIDVPSDATLNATTWDGKVPQAVLDRVRDMPPALLKSLGGCKDRVGTWLFYDYWCYHAFPETEAPRDEKHHTAMCEALGADVVRRVFYPGEDRDFDSWLSEYFCRVIPHGAQYVWSVKHVAVPQRPEDKGACMSPRYETECTCSLSDAEPPTSCNCEHTLPLCKYRHSSRRRRGEDV